MRNSWLSGYNKVASFVGINKKQWKLLFSTFTPANL